tara:strand:- start:91 stop:426 length:336 start_codon:yes stop_codon:yes gene_type:complete
LASYSYSNKNLGKLKDGKSKNDTFDGSSSGVAEVVVEVTVVVVVVVPANVGGDVIFFGTIAAVGVAAATDATTAAFGLVPFLIAGFVGGVADSFKATVAVSNSPEVSGRNV